MIHRPPRLTITPHTKELVFDIARAFDGRPAHDSTVLLKVTKRTAASDKCEVSLAASHIKDGKIHFEVGNLLTQATLPSGMYDGQLMRGNCILGKVEIIRAPGVAVTAGQANASECGTPDWVEPCCPEKPECEPEDTCVENADGQCPGTCVTVVPFRPVYVQGDE